MTSTTSQFYARSSFFVVILVVWGVFILFPVSTFAQSPIPTWDIGYTWSPGGSNIVVEEGGMYTIPLNVRKSTRYTWPSGGGVHGDIYEGTLHNAERIASHFMKGPGVQLEVDSFRQFGPHFVVIRSADSSREVEAWFERGASTTNPEVKPPGDWGILTFAVVNPNPEPDPVIVIPGILGSWEKNGELVIDPVFHTYDNLIETFRLNGFTEGEDLFTFPYDWRQSNVFTGGLLRDKINEVQEICDCDKVDLVAHSMGGLVARSYIQSGLYEDGVDQLVFLGTPHLGSPKAYLMWEGGEFSPGLDNFVLEKRFALEAKILGFDDLFDYIHNFPMTSLQELLPTFDYLRDSDTEILRNYPDGYPQNIFLENLNANVANLLNSGVRITNIVGNLGSDSTISALRVVDFPDLPKWEHGKPENFGNIFTDQGIEKGVGDETVPIESASFISEDLHEFDVSHRLLPDNNEIQSVVFKKLTNKVPGPISNDSSIPNALLFLKVLSPVDVQVIAPDGSKVGKDFQTGEEVNEIEGAFYSGFLTDDEYITIPDPVDGAYRVVVQGTDDGGEYTIATSYIKETGFGDTETTSYILPEATEEILLSLDSENPEDITSNDTTEITPETLIAHIEQAYLLGMITNEDMKDGLVEKAQAIAQAPNHNAHAGLINAFFNQLEAGFTTGVINKVGYNVLREDVNSLSL